MTFKKFKFSSKAIQLREAELELVTLLSNLSQWAAVKQNQETKFPTRQ